MTKTKYVYLSGPITGLTYGEARNGWRVVMADMLNFGIQVLSPMRHEGHLAEMRGQMSVENLKRFDKENSHLFSRPKMIVSKDFLDIDRCDLMIVNLQGAKTVSQGTLVEMGYAYARGKVLVVIMDNTDMVHTTPFIGVMANVVVDDVKDAAMIVNSLLSEGL